MVCKMNIEIVFNPINFQDVCNGLYVLMNEKP